MTIDVILRNHLDRFLKSRIKLDNKEPSDTRPHTTQEAHVRISFAARFARSNYYYNGIAPSSGTCAPQKITSLVIPCALAVSHR